VSFVTEWKEAISRPHEDRIDSNGRPKDGWMELDIGLKCRTPHDDVRDRCHAVIDECGKLHIIDAFVVRFLVSVGSPHRAGDNDQNRRCLKTGTFLERDVYHIIQSFWHTA
jgi:hypothetical protein